MRVSRKNYYRNSPGTLPIDLLWKQILFDSNFSGAASRVRHRGVLDRERVPDRCHSSGAAVDVCSDVPAGAQRAERAAEGGVVDVSRALSVSPRAP